MNFLENNMKVDMQSFQPLSLFNQFTKGNLKTANNTVAQENTHINKQNIATNVVNNRLNEALGIPSQAVTKSSDVFDFEKVTKNILNFVSGAISHAKDNGATEGELKKMLSDAKKGIKEGLSEASEELSGLGLMSENIQQGIEETSKQLKHGLQKLSEELFTSSENLPSAINSYREASHYNLTQDASFKFTTKEGDQVNITFNSDYLQQSASVLNSSENSLDYVSSQKMSFQGAFSFEVNGELNQDEQLALNELMGSLQNVSDLFFDGNLEEAFEEAKTISMDPTHLASFSMDLQRTETVVSIKEYQQVMPGKELAERFIPINDELTNAYDQAKPFAIEEHLNELLRWLAPDEKEKDNFLDYSQSVFEKLSSIASELRS